MNVADRGELFTAQARLRSANAVMGLGLLPFVFVVVWSALFMLTTVPGHMPVVPLLDPLAMIGLLMVTFFFACGVAGAGALWSWALVLRRREINTRKARALRLITVLVIVLPLVLALIEAR